MRIPVEMEELQPNQIKQQIQLLPFLQMSTMPLGLDCLFLSCHLEPRMDTGVPEVTYPTCIHLTVYGQECPGNHGVRIHMGSFTLLGHWGCAYKSPRWRAGFRGGWFKEPGHSKGM